MILSQNDINDVTAAELGHPLRHSCQKMKSCSSQASISILTRVGGTEVSHQR